MNVTVENLSPCKKLLRVEVDAAAVEAAFEDVTRGFQREAQLPGFRPGKAPRHLVLKAHAKGIETEVRRKLAGDTYRKAIDDQKLHVVGNPDLEEVQFEKGKPFQLAVTVEVAPEFELPDYKGLKAKREMRVVTDDDVERAIGMLRNQRSAYNDVSREVKDDDFVVVNYRATTDGKPLTDIAPTAKGLTQKENFWLHVQKDSFIPGFTEQLTGAKAGEKRTVTVTFPEDFVAKALSGKTGVYEVEIVQVKERKAPELNDEFAKTLGTNDVESLRAGVRADLQNELTSKLRRAVREQLIGELLSKVQFELPEAMVQAETRNLVYDLVNENQRRGIPRDAIEEKKQEIFEFASRSAKDRVKAAFILSKIAEKEGIKAEQQELAQRIVGIAAQQGVKPEKVARQLEENGGFSSIVEEIVNTKVLDFLELSAQVEEVVPAAPEA